MPKKDPRIDAYIARSGDFAKPILTRLRRLVHAGCPDVQETIKWSFPHFLHEGILCSMAAFKEHCTFGFWKGELILGQRAAEESAHGQFGRITRLADLPSDNVLLGYVRKAAQLNESGIKKAAPVRSRVKKELVVPEDLMAGLSKNPKARAVFEDFSYSHKKEYVEWIAGAKREETRQQRLKTAVEWMAGGKSRHWKYSRC
jgi:uncharacterized protein YdeI (YjbR/CyaY-like superfamily)